MNVHSGKLLTSGLTEATPTRNWPKLYRKVPCPERFFTFDTLTGEMLPKGRFQCNNNDFGPNSMIQELRLNAHSSASEAKKVSARDPGVPGDNRGLATMPDEVEPSFACSQN